MRRRGAPVGRVAHELVVAAGDASAVVRRTHAVSAVNVRVAIVDGDVFAARATSRIIECVARVEDLA